MSGVCKQPEDTTVKQTSRASDETKKKKRCEARYLLVSRPKPRRLEVHPAGAGAETPL